MPFNLFVSVKDSSLLHSVTMYLVILIVSCLMILVTEGRGVQGANSRKCAVVNIPLQKDFDAVKFQGKWYGGLKTTSEDSLLSYFMEIYDTRIIFTLNKEKTYDLKACKYPRTNSVISLYLIDKPVSSSSPYTEIDRFQFVQLGRGGEIKFALTLS